MSCSIREEAVSVLSLAGRGQREEMVTPIAACFLQGGEARYILRGAHPWSGRKLTRDELVAALCQLEPIPGSE
jgi:hypothetical protein